MRLHYKLRGFEGRFLSQSGRRMNLREVLAGDVVEVSTGRVRVIEVDRPWANSVRLYGPHGRFLEGRPVDKVRVWRPVETVEGGAQAVASSDEGEDRREG